MSTKIKILIVEDNEADRELMIREIKKVITDFETCVCFNKENLEFLLGDFKPDIVLTDYQISSSLNGMDVVKIVKSRDPFIPVIIISGSIGEEIAVECLRSGAGDYILKDRLKRLPYSILEQLEKEHIRREKNALFESLKESNERYRTMFENSKLPMLLIDPDNDLKIIDVNNAAVNFYGYTREEFKKLSIFNINILPREKVLELAKKAQSQSQSFFDFQHMIKGGDIKYVNVYSGPVKFGEKVNLLSIIVDVTERKLLEEKNKRLEEHVNHLNRIESLGRLAGTIAHDFNNILTPIIAYTEMGLTITEKGSDVHEYFHQIKVAADKASSLTRQILALGRKQVLSFHKVEIKSFFSEIHNMLKRLIREDIEFCVNIPDEELVVNIDTGQITQVLVNLIVNSVDALKNREKKKISIDVDKFYITQKMAEKYIDLEPGKYIMIAVSDTGCGISPEDQKKIFEPFYTTKLDSGGSGLGLAISLGIVKQHKGDIRVYSEPGIGTTFKIYLPAVEGTIEKEQPKILDDIGVLDCDLLFVEDDLMVAESIARGLKRYGCRVYALNDPSEAINKVLNEGYRCDILVTDLIMPKYDGKQLYMLLKDVIEDLKVIFISGYSQSILLDVLDTEKGVVFLQKPFDAKMLAKKIKEVLGKT